MARDRQRAAGDHGQRPLMASFVASNMPQTYLAWTGTDTSHSLNLLYTTSYPSWPASGTKSILDDMAYGAPQMAYIGGPQALMLAWAGTDAAHHLNVAMMTPSSACIAPPGISPVSSALITYGNTTRKQVTLT